MTGFAGCFIGRIVFNKFVGPPSCFCQDLCHTSPIFKDQIYLLLFSMYAKFYHFMKKTHYCFLTKTSNWSYFLGFLTENLNENEKNEFRSLNVMSD